MLKAEIFKDDAINHGFCGTETSFLKLATDYDFMMDFIDSIKAEALYIPIQIHGNNVASINSVKCADAVVTNKKNIAIAVRTADCVPVLFYDPVAEIIAVAHAGWRGALLGIIKKTIERMITVGSNVVSNIKVAIGPCILQDSFEVDEDFKKFFDSKYFKLDGTKHKFDLVSFIEDSLKFNGIKNIDKSAVFDTVKDERFFSHRRAQNKCMDRNISYIMLS